jgi:RNA polymerase sigma factor (sigma-70 family)
MTDSRQLLEDYGKNRSETAFRELVTRYIDLVYSTAFRLVDGDAHWAEDVAQTVFVDLSHEASGMSGSVMLGGWLHRHTCFLAAKAMRGERRRRKRERQAAEMSALNAAETGLNDMAPVLDEAINELGDDDRKAILLRFYERRDLRSIGEALGSSENAAQKRVARALDRLHVMLTRRGIALSATTLSAVLTAEAVTAAPAGLVASITGTVLSGAATGGTTLALAKILTMTKVKLSILSAFTVATAATSLIIQHQSQVHLRQENWSLRQQVGQLRQLETENERLSNLVAEANSRQTAQKTGQSELLRLRGEVTRLKATAPKTSLEAEAQGWPARVRQLRERLEKTPEHKIPELQLLTEDDWLDVARSKLDTEEDYRRSLSLLRRTGEQHFMSIAHSLTDLSQLKPYFASPIEDAILDCYKVLEKPIDPEQGKGPEITTKAPVDADYDVFRISITPEGYCTRMF